MKKILFILLFSYSIVAFSQETGVVKAPKQYSVEMGYRYMHKNTFINQANTGYTVLFDYAWQLSGFGGDKAPTYLSVPIGYTYLLADNGNANENMRILSYGWTVRHMFRKGKKHMPFLGYSLLLNQLSINGTEGQVFGHQTKFDCGVDFVTGKRLRPFVKAEWSMTRYPRLQQDKGDWLYAAELKAGFRF